MTAIGEYLNLEEYENLPLGVVFYAIGEGATLLYANSAALRILECDSLTEMQNFCRGNYLNFMFPEDYKNQLAAIRIAWESEKGYQHHGQYRVITPKGNTKWIGDTGKLVSLPEYGKCCLCMIMEFNIPSQAVLVHSDQLTGLLGLDQFIDHSESFLQTPSNQIVADHYEIRYFNIRHFKDYNVEYGAENGDHALKALTRALYKWSDTNVIARIAGDQFVALELSVESRDRIQNVIDEFVFEYGKVGMSVDVGVYPIQNCFQNIHTACDYAKIACDAIRNSRETICVYNEKLSERLKISNYVYQHLNEAIENHYIQVYYQPVIRTLTGNLCGMEALARWNDPVIGYLSPADFISVLEDHHLITKLDLYVLETICSDMKESEQRNLDLVPVSFNLSRIDFMDSDIFNEVERIVRKYLVPRDMLNIEITESMLMADSSMFRKTIQQFREGGYQVWMDDFGSGYSSLNVLKDYVFDEIKLDMNFLTNLDTTSRTIIESMIHMAKNIGIQTLAEGVETKEQLEFLRSIGCEKVQGFLFSKPLPYMEIQRNIREKRIPVEKRAWRGYYDAACRQNFITDRSFALVEFNGKDFDYLFVNPAYRDVWKSLGANDYRVIYEATNSESSILAHQLRELQMTMHAGDPATVITASVRGRYIRLKIQCVAAHDDHFVYTAELTNLSMEEDSKKREQMDYVFRMMYSLYDSIYLLDLQNGKFETVMHGTSNRVQDYREFHENQEINPLLAAKVFIHPNDQELYAKFVEPETIVSRLMAEKRRYLLQYFRTQSSNGAYVWKAHTMLYIPEIHGIIYCSRHANFGQPGLMERLAVRYSPKITGIPEKSFRHVLHQGILESRSISLFWKDKNRRFLGANERFLEVYGFSDLSEIVGKTDEDMGWHIEDENFRSDEIEVLEKGAIVRNRIGTCIIRGVAHTIMASKEPLYAEEQIVGLLGYFTIIDEIPNFRELPSNSFGDDSIRDSITSLMSASGLTNLLTQYVDGWRIQFENFAVIRITFFEYFRISKDYGEKTSRMLLQEIGTLIADIFGVKASCSRLYAGNFVVLMKTPEKSRVQELVFKLQDRIQRIHSMNGYPITLNPKVESFFADETEDIRMLQSLVSGGTALDLSERRLLEEQLSNYDLRLNTVIDALPGGIVLHEVVGDIKLRIIYVSAGVAELSGRTVEQFLEEASRNYATGMVEKDIAYVDQAVYRTIHEGAPLDVCYRIYHKNGNILWLNMKGRVIGEQNGHPLLLCIFQKITDASNSYERVLDDTMVGVIVHAEEDNEVLYLNRSAKALVDEYFDGSIFALQAEMRSKGTELGVYSPEKETNQFELVCRDRHLMIQSSRRLWNGRKADVIYVLDQTAKFYEEQSTRELLGNIPASVIVFSRDLSGVYRIIYLSDRARDWVDTRVFCEDTFDSIMKLVYPEDKAICYEVFEQAVKSDKTVFAEYRLRNKIGRYFWIRLSLTTKRQPDGSIQFFGVYTDIDERKHWEESHLIEIQETDTLPKSETSRRFSQIIGEKKQGGYALLMLDVDDLKYINDTFGHPVGDNALYAVVKIFHETFRRSDIIGKIGGDEYLVLLDGMTNKELLSSKLQTVIQKVNEVQLYRDPEYYLHCSMGVVIANHGTYSFDEAYHAVDQVLYKAKHQGKNSYVVEDHR